MALGLQAKLFLGNLDARRDWGHARDYVEAQWLMLQQAEPEDFVIATGAQYSVRDFVNAAFAEVGVGLEWKGSGVGEKGVVARINKAREGATPSADHIRPGQLVVEVDPRYFRPTEVETLLGDASRAREKLGWSPKVSFGDLVSEMVREDLAAAERDHLCQRKGFRTFSFHE